MNWQPIDTAPKDGTWVLIWKPGWEIAYQARYTYGQWRDGGAGHFADPTHWRPNPPPPDATDNDCEVVEALHQAVNAMLQKGWDHDAGIVARHATEVPALRSLREIIEDMPCYIAHPYETTYECNVEQPCPACTARALPSDTGGG